MAARDSGGESWVGAMRMRSVVTGSVMASFWWVRTSASSVEVQVSKRSSTHDAFCGSDNSMPTL